MSQSEKISFTDFTLGQKHSYENYTPKLVERLIDTIGVEPSDKETEKTASDALTYIESGRWEACLEKASEFFFRLDSDEQELFTRRNPDLVEWITVYDEANGMTGHKNIRATARRNLADDREKATSPPKFTRERGSARYSRGLYPSLKRRRRSYRNWVPKDFIELINTNDTFTISTAIEASDINLKTINSLDVYEFPLEAEGSWVGKSLIRRIEQGRFDELLEALTTHHAHLDQHERNMFARRNPGIIIWLNVRNRMTGEIHGDELYGAIDKSTTNIP